MLGELINWIIRELDPTASAVENDKVVGGSGGVRADETVKIPAKFKNIKKSSKAKNSAKARRFGTIYLPKLRS